MFRLSIMVRSILDPTINYPEIRSLDDNDIDYDAPVYDARFLNVSIAIAIGQARYAFIDKNIVYYPIYLLSDGIVVMQIGVYEVFANRVPSLSDKDGDLDLGLIESPLLYSYISQTMLSPFKELPIKKHDSEKHQSNKHDREKHDSNKYDSEKHDSEKHHSKKYDSEKHESEKDRGKRHDSEKHDSEMHDSERHDSIKHDSKKRDSKKRESEKYSTSESESENEDVDEVIIDETIVLSEQNSAAAAKERSEFISGEGDVWVQEYMSNNNYDLADNEGAGDCLFASIRDGLATIGEKVTVSELRDILVKHADEAVFSNYRMIYLDALANVQSLDKEQRTLTKQQKALKVRREEAVDRDTEAILIAESEEITARREEVKLQKKSATAFLSEWNWMKGIDTLEAFHARLQTCEFWGDTWAISTLEVALNIKLILLSSDSFEDKDLDNVLQCGQMNDTVLEELGEFTPRLYIILDYEGEHYQLVKYKNKGAFTFKELPYDMKRLLVDKCLERQSGAFSLIPEFKEFMGRANLSPPKLTTATSSTNDNEHTVFQFYLQSSDRPRPGKGAGETMGPEGPSFYNELSTIPKWRKKLDNSWEEEFTLDGKRWLSVEHYYQASKFKKGHPEFYNQFSLDSGSELSKSPAMAKAAGSSSRKYGKKEIRPASIKIDEDFFIERHKSALNSAMHAKFSQNKELNTMLLATGSAKLQQFVRGAEPIVFDDLMQVRKELRQEPI